MTAPILVRVVERLAVAQTKIEVLELGRQGPPGPGEPTYTHAQPVAATQWTINHNLGFRPAVELFDDGGNPMIADVAHPTANQTIVQLKIATAGSARLT